MKGLMSTLPVSPPPVVGSLASNSGSVASVRAARVTEVTAPLGAVGTPLQTSENDPFTARPPLWVGTDGNCGPASVT